jgi:hypothetical protein
MITVKPKLDGSNGIIFECSEKDENDYLNSHAHEILDKFVRLRIKNIGKMKIETFKEYVDFCKSSPKTQLEIMEGHAIKAQDFGELEAQNSILMSFEATKRLAPNEDAFKSLQTIANEMFEKWRLEA